MYMYVCTHARADRKDKDPLGNRDILLHDIISVGRDGVGGAMAKRHGCMYRIEVRGCARGRRRDVTPKAKRKAMTDRPCPP